MVFLWQLYYEFKYQVRLRVYTFQRYSEISNIISVCVGSLRDFHMVSLPRQKLVYNVKLSQYKPRYNLRAQEV